MAFLQGMQFSRRKKLIPRIALKNLHLTSVSCLMPCTTCCIPAGFCEALFSHNYLLCA